jgi:superoxide dismutase
VRRCLRRPASCRRDAGRTLSFHHGKHHRSYVETLNKLIAGTELADLSLDELVTRTAWKGAENDQIECANCTQNVAFRY